MSNDSNKKSEHPNVESSTTTVEPMRELIERWRKRGEDDSANDCCYDALNLCADELETILGGS